MSLRSSSKQVIGWPQLIQLGLICTAVILVTIFRVGLVIIYPLFVIVFCYIFNFRLSVGFTVLFFFSLVLLPLAFVFNEQPLMFNTVLSIYIIYPVLFLFLSRYSHARREIEEKSLHKRFIKYLTIIMTFNNLIGVVQFIILRYDDSFTGLYGTHGTGAHGLGIINGLLFINYFIRFKHNPRWGLLFLMLFFLCSFVMSFFGLALVLLLASFLLYYFFFQFSIGNTLKFGSLVFIILVVLFLTSSKTFTYNYNTLENTAIMVSDQDFSTETEMPRKLTLFYNYATVFASDAKLFLFGTGPGTFNSRTSFLLNGDYSNNLLVNIVGANEPEYAAEYAYSLWNSSILSIQFNDGTRNQPFSSVLAFLAEYGFLFSLILLIISIRKFRYVLKGLHSAAEFSTNAVERRGFLVNREFLIVAGLFVILLLLTNNLIENTEILVFIIVMKLMEMTLPRQRELSNLAFTDKEQ